MNAVRITSSSVTAGRSAGAGEGTNFQTAEPAAALSASTSEDSASSRRSGPAYCAEFSISSRDSTSAPRVLIAATILARWRSRFSVVRGAAGAVAVAGVDGHGVAGAVVVEAARAAVGDEVVTGLGEEVQHVEAGDLEVAADRGRRGGAGVRERRGLHGGGVRGGQLLGGLELPGAVAVVEHDRLGERRRRTDPDRVLRGQVGQRGVLAAW